MQLYPTICSCAAFLVYITSLNCGFVFDDSAAILKNYDLRQSHPWTELFENDFWGTPMRSERSHKSYRPITVLTFRINYLLQELEPFGYHLVNAVLHTLASVLLYLFLSSKTIYPEIEEKPTYASSLYDRTTAFMASLLFAVHPVHVEAVTGVVGRAEILSLLASIAVLYFYTDFANYASVMRKGASPNYCSALCAYFATFITLGIAMLCKETGITTCAVCAVFDLYFICKKSLRDVWDELMPFIIWTDKPKESRKNGEITNKNPKKTTHMNIDKGGVNVLTVSGWLRRLVFRQLLLLTALIVLVVLRIYLVQGGQMPSFTAFDNPAAMAKSPVKEMTLNYLLPINTWLLLCPWWLCCDWSMGTIPLIQSPFDPRNLTSVMFWCGLLIACRRCFAGRDKLTAQIAFALALIVFPFLPASNLLFPVGFVVAERVLYTPSVGFCILVAMGLQRLVHIVKRFERNRVTGTSGPSGKYLIYGCLLVTIGAHFAKTSDRNYDWKDEFSLFISAVKNNKFNAKCWNNVGHSLENQERYYEALSFFHQATKVQPDDVGAIINVARTLKNLNMTSEAEKWFYHAIDFIPKSNSQKMHQQHSDKPGLLLNENDYDEDEDYNDALGGNLGGGQPSTRMNPNYLYAFISLANMIKEDPLRMDEADKLYQRAYTMRFDQVDAYTNRGELLIRQNRTKEAREMFLRARKYDEKNADIWYNLGVTFLLENKQQEAFPLFSRALTLDPTHRRSKFNYASLLLEMQPPTQLQNPQHVGGGVNAAQQQQQTREANYRQAVHLLEQMWAEDIARDGGQGTGDHKVASRLANFYIDTNNREQAVIWHKRATQVNPSDHQGFFNLALVLSELNRFKESLEYVDKAIQVNPKYVKAFALKGDVLAKVGHKGEAIEAFEGALAIDPSHLISGHNLCVNLFNFHQPQVPQQVLDCFEKYTKMASPGHDIHKHYDWIKSQMKPVQT